MSNEIRLNKYLSEAGICSRREADRLIEAGKVMVERLQILEHGLVRLQLLRAMEIRYGCAQKR